MPGAGLGGKASAWDAQMLFLGMHGYRVIAHDRPRHGAQVRPATGNEMDNYATIVATLFQHA